MTRHGKEDPHSMTCALMNAAAEQHFKRQLHTRFTLAETEADRRSVFELRAATAVQRFRLPPDAFPGGIDHDTADATAVLISGWRRGELVATGRLVFAKDDERLPTEDAFDLELEDRSSLVEVGRVIVRADVSDASSGVLLALIGALWQHAEGRHRWLGANSAGVIRTYRRLGAPYQLLGASRLYHGERRSPVIWDMQGFAPAYAALAHRPAEATALRNERDTAWPLL